MNIKLSDWHPEDIKAAIRKKGITLADLARDAGMAGNALRLALSLPRAEAERVIAAALDLHPMVIWPSRYHADGRRKQPQPADNYRAARRFGNAESLSHAEAAV
ncbi:helix-turn-helix domain-containing protein [Sphingomonas cannabina]|uniref:helix-turn-helix domain-containing protein n=1 Tax=Sphingomonas cannabina TaxID=2899123 RepID=UPI001F182F96|nr:helix-turn-helix transcriptional regulator [Sphingomonas cannabina]UIJ46915.1 helix-turn-helix domain-containing protein [Sphingomonas cannabina]